MRNHLGGGELLLLRCLYYYYEMYMSDKVCQVLAVGQWFHPGTPVSSKSETDISSASSLPRYDPGSC